MNQKLIRIYAFPDSDMLVAADAMQVLYQKDEQDFQRLNPKKFTPTYAVDFKAYINAARAEGTDGVVVDETAKETEDVKRLLEGCRSHYQDLKYYIETAFPNNQLVWNQFGYNDYKAARANAGKMIQFMDSLYNTALKYKVNLLENGYSDEKIEQIDALANQLRNETIEQKDAKKSRPTKTGQRIEKLNQVWSRMMEINSASKNIYRDQPAKLKQYLLPANPKPAEKPDNQEDGGDNK